MNKAPEIKKNKRSKSEGLIKHISQPFGVKHDLHIGQETFEESNVFMGHRRDSPPAPCPGIGDNLDQVTLQEQTISRLLREEIIPALRFEIGDLIEENIKKVFNERITGTEPYHCKSCTCDELTPPNKIVNVLDDSPKPCVPIILEHSDTLINIEEKRRQFRKQCFSNPVYHHKGQVLLVPTEHGTRTVNHGSTESRARDDSLKRSSNLKGKLLSRSDERECLAHALQYHIHELVDGIIFKDSELPDALLVDNCLTEDECENVRKISDRKDQVRVLLCLVKGRDFHVLKKFLQHIRSHNDQIAKSIEMKFEQNKKEGKRCSKCALCQLKAMVNLKYIVDDLWKAGLINDGLFCMIVQTDKPAGAQDDLWNDVIDSFNTYSVQSPRDVGNTLRNALKKKDHYNQVAKCIDMMIFTHRKLVCGCKLRNIYVAKRTYGSMISSISPMSSSSDAALDTNNNSGLSLLSIESENPIIGSKQASVECRGKIRILEDYTVSNYKTNNAKEEIPLPDSTESGLRSSYDKEKTPSDSSNSTRDHSLLTKSYSGPVATASETMSTANNRLYPAWRPPLTRQHAVDDWKISHV